MCIFDQNLNPKNNQAIPLQKMGQIAIDSNWSKLLKTVGLLCVRLDLAKLRLKNY